MGKFKVIGISGNIGSGKDTFARWLMQVGIAQKNTAFAKSLKLTAKQLFDVGVGERTDRARHVLQQLGTKMREIDPDVWVNQVEKEVQSTEETLVITDVRHVNEAEWIVNREDGLLIILICPDELRRKRVADRDYGGNDMGETKWITWHEHESETNVPIIHDLHVKLENVIVIFQRSNDFRTNKKLLIASLHDNFPSLIPRPVLSYYE